MYQTMKAQGVNLRASEPKQVVAAALVFEGYLRGKYSDVAAGMMLGASDAFEQFINNTPDLDAGEEPST